MKKFSICVSLFLALTACSSLSVLEKEHKRSAIDKMATKAVAELIEDDEALQQLIDSSLGYAVANMKVTKVPIVGAGGGEGVYFNTKTGERTYFTVSRLDVGGGWGVRSYKMLFVMNSQEVVDGFKGGAFKFKTGVEVSAGTVSAEGSLKPKTEGYSVHVLSDGGASATATARVIRLKINKKLNL